MPMFFTVALFSLSSKATKLSDWKIFAVVVNNFNIILNDRLHGNGNIKRNSVNQFIGGVAHQDTAVSGISARTKTLDGITVISDINISGQCPARRIGMNPARNIADDFKAR